MPRISARAADVIAERLGVDTQIEETSLSFGGVDLRGVAGARNLWIRLSQDEDGVALTAHDDGRGASELYKGNGLSGMSERLQQLGGELRLESSPGAGFSLHAWLPREGL